MSNPEAYCKEAPNPSFSWTLSGAPVWEPAVIHSCLLSGHHCNEDQKLHTFLYPSASAEDIIKDDSQLRKLPPSVCFNFLCPLSLCQFYCLWCGWCGQPFCLLFREGNSSKGEQWREWEILSALSFHVLCGVVVWICVSDGDFGWMMKRSWCQIYQGFFKTQINLFGGRKKD